MAELRKSGKSMQDRLNDRLRNSGGEGADSITKHGDGARRTFHNLHITGQGANRRRLSENQRGDAYHQQSQSEGDE